MNLGVISDDGIKIWIEDGLVIESWINQRNTLFEKVIEVEENKKHKLKVEWFDGGGDYVCKLLWKMNK